MAENSCPYHTDHNNRLKKLEQNYEELDDRVTVLDKEYAVNRAEITSALKNLEKLPETMSAISTTMVSLQGEISQSNECMGRLENSLYSLNNRMEKVDEEGKFNIRTWWKNNWVGFVIGATTLIALGARWLSNIF